MKITSSLPKAAAIGLLILIAAAGENLAATFTVTNTNNSGPGSFRQAVTDSNNAPGSDTIVFDPAVFSTAQTIALLNAILVSPGTGESLTITGPGASLLTIRGNGSVEGAGQIFNRNANTAHALLLSGMTLTNAGFTAVPNNFAGPETSLTVTNVAFVANGNPFGGGGIASTAALTVTGCTFTDNFTSSGGGSGSNGGGAINSDTSNVAIPVTITGSTFTGNTADSTFAGSGGAVNNRSGAMTITNCTFTNNRSRNVGGAVNNGGVLSISGSTLSGNSTTGPNAHGGGVSSHTTGQLTITNSILTGNSAAGNGGGVYAANSGTTNITNSTISANIANSDGADSGSGGGLYFRSDTPLSTISGSTISGNQALLGNGGGIDAQASLNLTNSTISGNIAGAAGGGIFDGYTGGPAAGSAIVVTSSTIANNTAGSVGGGGVSGSDQFGDGLTTIRNTIIANNTANTITSHDVKGPISSQGYNLIRNTSGATITGDTGTNITGQDPLLGPLQNNGGPTFTHALLAGSPAVDKGQSFGLTTDQRGQTRPFDNAAIPNAASGDGADIGAVEVTMPIVLGVVSRKTHGASGTFDIILSTTPGGVECRTGPNYQAIVTFTAPVTVGGLSITSRDGQASGTRTVSGATVTVNLTGVVNAQTLGITLLNVNDGSAQGDVFVPMSVLIGDINGSGSVTTSDIGQVKSLSGQPVTSVTFRGDVNVSGAIGASDIGQVKAAAGTQLP